MVETIPTANQRALCWWFLKLPWREKRKVPSERAMKTESETGVKSDTPFCSRLPIEKTNSEPRRLPAGKCVFSSVLFIGRCVFTFDFGRCPLQNNTTSTITKAQISKAS